MKKSLLIALIFGASFCSFAGESCELNDTGVPQSEVILSNGMQVQVPTVSEDFDVYAIVGWLDLKKVTDLVKGEGASMYPLEFGKKTLGMLMFYRYNQSDMGPFNEVYFFTALSKKRKKNFVSSLFELRKLYSKYKKAPSKDISFYYFNVFSGTEIARLASQEIWKIRSTQADISLEKLFESGGSHFDIRVDDKLLASYHSHGKTKFKSKLSANLNLFIAGTNPEGDGPVYSPIESCGKFAWAKFKKKKHKLWFGDNAFGKLAKELHFKPILLFRGLNLKASQKAPIL